MKRVLLAIVALAALAIPSAFAADMPPGRYMPPPRAPAYVPYFSWTGFYVGINAGYGFGNSNWTNTTTQASTGNFSASGGLIGGTAGYNLQLGGAVVGIEADIDWSGIKGSTTTNCAGTCETSNNWLGTARGRLGYAFDRFMPYATGGAAFGDIKAERTGGAAAASTRTTQMGWTAGAGLEYSFVSNWSAKLEYLYVDLGKFNCPTGCSPANPVDVKFNTSVMRAGVNYKF